MGAARKWSSSSGEYTGENVDQISSIENLVLTDRNDWVEINLDGGAIVKTITDNNPDDFDLVVFKGGAYDERTGALFSKLGDTAVSTLNASNLANVWRDTTGPSGMPDGRADNVSFLNTVILADLTKAKTYFSDAVNSVINYLHDPVFTINQTTGSVFTEDGLVGTPNAQGGFLETQVTVDLPGGITHTIEGQTASYQPGNLGYSFGGATSGGLSAIVGSDEGDTVIINMADVPTFQESDAVSNAYLLYLFSIGLLNPFDAGHVYTDGFGAYTIDFTTGKGNDTVTVNDNNGVTKVDLTYTGGNDVFGGLDGATSTVRFDEEIQITDITLTDFDTIVDGQGNTQVTHVQFLISGAGPNETDATLDISGNSLQALQFVLGSGGTIDVTTGGVNIAGVFNSNTPVFLTWGDDEFIVRSNVTAPIYMLGGDDVVAGNDQGLQMSGGVGNDTITGGDANDTIDGGEGNDVINAGGGTFSPLGNGNTISGGEGDDIISLANSVTDDVIDGGEGMDTIDFSAVVGAQTFNIGDGSITNTATGTKSFSGIDRIVFGDNNNTIFVDAGFAGEIVGGNGTNTYFGSEESDRIIAGAGNDEIYGLGGDDTLSGNAGDNTINAGDGDDIIFSTTGNDTVDGWTGFDVLDFSNGLFNDTVFTVSGNSVTSANTGTETIFSIEGIRAGAGNDEMFGDAGISHVLYGFAGNDILHAGDMGDGLFGEAGNDTLLGGAGNDTLDGGDGFDTMSGGAGDDTYAHSGVLVDVIFDSSGSNDQIVMGSEFNVMDTRFSQNGTDLDIQIQIGPSSFQNVLLVQNHFVSGNEIEKVSFDGGSFYDFTTGDYHIVGTTGDDTLIENGNVGNFNGNDFIDGGEGDDTVAGGAGDDSLYGGAGDDVLFGEYATLSGGSGDDILDGGDGNDIMRGGAFNDLYIFSSGNDTIQEVITASAADQLYFGPSRALEDLSIYRLVDTADDLEDLYIADFDGNSVFIEGQFAGSPAAVELLLFGDGEWTQTSTLFDFSPTTTFVDTLQISTYGSDNDNVLYGLQAGASPDDVMFGNGGNDTLFGLDGNDYLAGDDGDDTIDGGIGDNTLDGGIGNDTYVVNEGTALISDFGDTDTISFGPTFLAANMTLERSGIFDLNILFSGNVVATITDQFTDYGQIETILFDDASTFDLLSVQYTTNGTAGDDTLYGISFGGNPADIINGLDGNDVLIGMLGDDTLDGGLGDDTLDGGDGDDTYLYSAGFDIVADLSGNDTVSFAAGFDQIDMTFGRDATDLTISFSGVPAIQIAGFFLGFGVETLAFSDSSTFDLTAFQDVLGTENDDVLIGLDNAALQADFIYGFDGNDTISGGAGDDHLLGGQGDDVYNFDAGFDTVNDEAGAQDKIVFAAGFNQGDMTLVRSGENDVEILFNGTPAVRIENQFTQNGQIETLEFSDSSTLDMSSVDYVTDGTSGNDTLTGITVGGGPDDTLRGFDGDDHLIGLDGNDTLEGGSGANSLEGGIGDDTYIVTSDADTVSESGGNDVITFGAGYDLADMTLERSGATDLNILFNGVLAITIQNQFTPAGQIETLTFDDSSAFDLLSVQYVTTGTNVADVLQGIAAGGNPDDQIFGLDGDDQIFGLAGADTMDGGLGNDTVSGGTGDDDLDGHSRYQRHW